MSYDVKINRQGISALFDLKGTPEAIASWAGDALPDFPDASNAKTVKDGTSLCHIGRNHWILQAGIDREEALAGALKPDEAPPDISIVRVSDTLSFFDVTGPDAGEVMAIACPLDLHPSVFGTDSVTYSEVFGLKALVQRREGGFEFAIEQSFGDMVVDYLARATA